MQMLCIWSTWCTAWQCISHPIISCFIKMQISLTFLMPAYSGWPLSWCLPVCPGLRFCSKYRFDGVPKTKCRIQVWGIWISASLEMRHIVGKNQINWRYTVHFQHNLFPVINFIPITLIVKHPFTVFFPGQTSCWLGTMEKCTYHIRHLFYGFFSRITWVSWQQKVQELIRRWDSEHELLRSAPWKLPEFAEITQNNGHCAIQGHRFWYQSKAHIQLPISDQY